MKYTKHIIAITAILLATTTVAQNSKDTTYVKRDMTIEREYNPVIMDAKKVNQNLVVEEPVFEKKQVVYSSYDAPLSIKSPSVTLPQAPLTAMERYDYKNGYAHLAIGAPLCWNVDFAYPIVNKNNCQLNFAINHYGEWWKGEKNKMIPYDDGYKWAHRQKIDTRGNLNFTKDWRNSELYMGLTYLNRAFNYSGTTADSTFIFSDTPHTRYQRFNNIDFILGYKALPSADLLYDVAINYNLFGAPSQYLEHQAGLHATLDIPIPKNKKHHIAFRLGGDALFYNKMNNYTDTIPATSGVVEFSPMWRMIKKNLHLNLGLKAYFAFGRDNRIPNIAPDVELEYFIKPEKVSFYIGASGGYQLNSMRNIFGWYRFSNINTAPADTYTPLSAHIGIKIKPISHLFIDAFARYQLVVDELLYTNSPLNGDSTLFDNTFIVQNSDWQQLTAGLHINYNYKDQWNIYLKAQYNGWWHLGKLNTEEHAWYQPAAELTIGGNVNITPDWRLSASYYLAAIRYAKVAGTTHRLRDAHDLNLSVSYSHSNWLTAYIAVENLLGIIPNTVYQDWYGYNRWGAAKIGIIFSF